MSKNLSEETPGKVVAAQGYGVRQLFRRPAPVSDAGLLPYSMMVWNEGETIAVDTPYNFQTSVGNDLTDTAAWDFGYDSNPELFKCDLANGRMQMFPDSGTTCTPGHYLVHITVSWAENWDNGDLYVMVNHVAGTVMSVEGWQTKVAYAKTQGTSHLLTFDESVELTETIIIPEDLSSTNGYIAGALLHRGGGGSSRSLGQVSLTVVRLSEYPIAGGGFVP